jgi:hypothetical protein
MRSKEEIIKSYIGSNNLNGISVHLNREEIKDIMNLWGEEIIYTITVEMKKTAKTVRVAMYPDPVL